MDAKKDIFIFHIINFWKIYLFIICLLILGVFLVFVQVYFEMENALAIANSTPILHGDFKIEIIKSLSQVLLISGVMSIFAELILRKSMLKDFSSNTSNLLESFFNKTLNNSVQYGFQGLTDSFDFKNFFSSAEPGDEILWLDTYAPGHTQWLSTIEEQALLGIKFKFLVLEPNCNEAILRSKEIGGRYEHTFNRELEIFIFDLVSIANKINKPRKKVIEIKMYNDLLALPFYVIKKKKSKDYAASSCYLREATGVKFPHLEWRYNGHGSFVNILTNYHKWKWDNAVIVPSNYLLEENNPTSP